jgi:hypothetical protein
VNDEELIAQLVAEGYSPEEAQAAVQQLAAPGSLAETVNRVTSPQAAAGIGTAGALAGVTKAVQSSGFFDPSARGARRVKGAIAESGGVEALLKRIQDMQGAGRGDLLTLGDVSPHLLDQADFVATSNEPARIALGQLHEQRQGGVPGRVKQDVSQLSPTGEARPRLEAKQVAADKAAFADSPAGFEGLRQANPTLVNPVGFAQSLEQPENRPLKDVFAKARATAITGGGSDVPSFRLLQQMKRELDAQIKAAFAAGDGDLGKDLKRARSNLYEIMEEQVGPQYREAVATYRRMSRQEDLLQEGLDFWNARDVQIADLEAQVAGMTPRELESYRRGVAGGLLTRIENAKKGGNVARELLKESDLTQRKLELIFGSGDELKSFMSRLQIEDQLARLGGAVGGSATARRGQSLLDPADIASDAVSGGPQGMMTGVARKAPSFMARRTASKRRPWFTAQGSEKVAELIRLLGKL